MQIVVLGMHRSGTSAVSRLINLMGASLGPAELVGRPSFDNAKGFWERRDVREINDQLLASRGAAWDNPWPAADGEFKLSQAIAGRMAGTVFALDTARPWVLKDPRFSLTFPVWRPFLESAVCVLPVRRPGEVALSLNTRNGLSIEHGCALWEHYVRHAARATAGLALVVVSYQRLVEDPVGTVMDLHADLQRHGCTGLRLPSSKEIRAFVQPEMNHHRGVHPVEAEPWREVFESLANEEAFSEWVNAPDSPATCSLLKDYAHARSQANQEIDDSAVGGGSLTAVHSTERRASAVSGEFSEGTQFEKYAREITNRLDGEFARLEHLRAESRQLMQRLAKLESEAEQRPLALEVLQNSVEALHLQIASEVRRREVVQEQLFETRAALAESARGLHAWRVAAENAAADATGLVRWLSDTMELVALTRQSARWRVGNELVRWLERLMLRTPPRLAMDRLGSIESKMRAWMATHAGHLESIRALREQSFDPTNEIAPGVPSKATTSGRPHRFPVRNDGSSDFVCFPVIDWHFRVQRPQHLMRVLGELGHRCFYLSTQSVLGCDEPGFDMLESPCKNVWLIRLRLTETTSPNIYTDRLDGIALEAYIEALDVLREQAGIHAPVALVDLPFWRPVIVAIPGASLIYDCMDHHAGFSTNTEDMLSEEDRLIQEADAVIVTSRWLQDQVGAKASVELIHNAADVARFMSPPANPLTLSSRPVIGYVGAISDWFDLDLIVKLARKREDLEFVLVGDVTCIPTDRIPVLANLHFVGEVPYEEAARYVHAFDVCLIPFKLCELTLATNPVKVYEYLAAGKPVVSTALPEVCELGDLVCIAECADGFSQQIDIALREGGDLVAKQRRCDWARGQDWISRGKAIEQVAVRLRPKASVIVLCWNNWGMTAACLESIDRFTSYPSWELILVDNGSTDGTPERLRSYANSRPHVKLVLNTENLGFAAGNNAGIRASTGEILVLLNNDTYVTPGWLHGLAGHLRRNPKLGLVGPVTNNIGNEARIDIAYADMEAMRRESRRWTRAHGRMLTPSEVVAFFCVAMPRAVVEEVGLLDEDFGQGFFEDDDYCRRVRATGRSVAIADDVFVHHHLSASFDTLPSAEKQALFERNKVIFERKWGAWTPHAYREPR